MAPSSPATDPVLAALSHCGASIRAVRYRQNRTVLLSVSRDGRTLNSHACFRDAPPEIAADIARWVTSPRGSSRAGEALARIRAWEGTRRGLAEARRTKPPRARPNGAGSSALRTLFDRLNRRHFSGSLPAVPLRVSRRMTRSLGTIRYGGVAAGADGSGSGGPGPEPRVLEIAISADLLLPRNRHILEDTMLHEMAHAEAWLRHGHRGHGRVWRRIAERVGCTPTALCRHPVHRPRRRRHD